MPHKSFSSDELEKLTEQILKSYRDDSGTNFIDVKNLPVRDKVLSILDMLRELLFPGYTGRRPVTSDNIRSVCRRFL